MVKYSTQLTPVNLGERKPLKLNKRLTSVGINGTSNVINLELSTNANNVSTTLSLQSVKCQNEFTIGQQISVSPSSTVKGALAPTSVNMKLFIAGRISLLLFKSSLYCRKLIASVQRFNWR